MVRRWLRRRLWPVHGRDNRRLRRAGAAVRAVFIGDSITAGWRAADPGFFTAGIVNRGIGGETSGDVLARFAADVIRLAPTAMHIMVGINDLIRGTAQAEIEGHIAAMVRLAQSAGIRVLLASLTPVAEIAKHPGCRPAERIVAVNAWLRDHAARTGCFYVDYHAMLADAAGSLRAGYSVDGLHLSPAAYAAMRPLALAALSRTASGPACDRTER